jgi:hypothetical protein
MSEYRVLDLFAGLGGFSQAFAESSRWSVTTVELLERFEPDIQGDIFELRPSSFDREFDVILASPPCEEFSPANNLNGERDPDPDAVALVYHALGLIRGLDPTFWFVENPRGRLRSYIGQPSATVTYCQYGENRMKPTDLWGEHPHAFVGRRCDYGDDCHESNREGTNNYPDDPNEKAEVPYDLSESIRDACEAALDGDAPVQTTAAEWIDA